MKSSILAVVLFQLKPWKWLSLWCCFFFLSLKVIFDSFRLLYRHFVNCTGFLLFCSSFPSLFTYLCIHFSSNCVFRMKPVSQSAEAESGEGESEMERIKQVRIEASTSINIQEWQKCQCKTDCNNNHKENWLSNKSAYKIMWHCRLVIAAENVAL